MADVRFELNEIKELKGTIHISITILRVVPGSERQVKGGYQRTNMVFGNHWQLKDRQLLAMNDKLEWAPFEGQSDEADFVRNALRSHGYL